MNQSPFSTRRQFLQTGSAATATAALASTLAFPSVLRGAPDSRKLKVGLVGCGGRGTGAANQALSADSNVELWALADVFADQLERSAGVLQKQQPEKFSVPKERQFTGLDAYEKLIASGVDVVLLATPPAFRPQHLRAAVEAGKHTFVEKPVATDAPGVRHVLETTEMAKRKGLSIVSGLCWRYEPGMIEVIKRLRDGAIGDLVTLESQRYGGGVGKLAKRDPDWTDLQYQLRNWYYYTWLSGDFIVEQFVHELDKMAWAASDYPVSCIASGGRQARTGAEYGHIWDHFNCTYTFASGLKLYAGTRHWSGSSNEWHDLAFGTRGRCDMMRFTITGANPWQGPRKRADMHQLEHDAMYAALRRGDIINNGEYMAKSTLMGILGRQAAYTGKELTWEQALNSQERLVPEKLDWGMKLPEPPVAVPGVTRFG